ncbi:MAG: hypothetical protein KDC71_19510, partial [Acidobacteria bacterium]|nr:hypothetical protein [Acidobacteriota bacterium]
MSPKIIKNPSYTTSSFKFKDFSELDEADLHFSTPVSHEPFDSDAHLDFEQSISSEVDIQKIVQKARQDADLILRKAREEAAQIEKNAYERGLKEGQKSGELIAQQQMQPVLARYQSAIQNLLSVRNQIENEAQIDLAE